MSEHGHEKFLYVMVQGDVKKQEKRLLHPRHSMFKVATKAVSYCIASNLHPCQHER